MTGLRYGLSGGRPKCVSSWPRPTKRSPLRPFRQGFPLGVLGHLDVPLQFDLGVDRLHLGRVLGFRLELGVHVHPVDGLVDTDETHFLGARGRLALSFRTASIRSQCSLLSQAWEPKARAYSSRASGSGLGEVVSFFEFRVVQRIGNSHPMHRTPASRYKRGTRLIMNSLCSRTSWASPKITTSWCLNSPTK